MLGFDGAVHTWGTSWTSEALAVRKTIGGASRWEFNDRPFLAEMAGLDLDLTDLDLTDKIQN